MKTSFTRKKNTIRLHIIDSTNLIDVFVEVPCYRFAIFAYMFHLFKNCSSILVWQGKKEIFYGSRTALSLIVTPASFII